MLLVRLRLPREGRALWWALLHSGQTPANSISAQATRSLLTLSIHTHSPVIHGILKEFLQRFLFQMLCRSLLMFWVLSCVCSHANFRATSFFLVMLGTRALAVRRERPHQGPRAPPQVPYGCTRGRAPALNTTGGHPEVLSRTTATMNKCKATAYYSLRSKNLQDNRISVVLVGTCLVMLGNTHSDH